MRAPAGHTSMKSIATISLLALALASVNCAAATDGAPDKHWNTSAELGAITTSGNTTGSSFTGKIDAKQELPVWSNEYVLTGYYKEDEAAQADGQQERVVSAERFSLSAKAAYKLLQPGSRLFVLASYVDDKFGAYTRYSTIGIGQGSQWYKSDDKSVDVEIGPGYFSGTRATGEEDNGMTIRGAAALKWKLSDTAALQQTMSVERGAVNTHSMAETSLSTKINSTMQMKAAFTARNDTNVPEDKKNTDTQTSVTLVYSF
jgi:putative salt-induced outer membrane protein